MNYMERVITEPKEGDDFWIAKENFERSQDAFFTAINESSRFNAAAYCDERRRADPWVTVDIGPGTKPSGLNRKYEGESRYVAFEPCLNPWYATRSEVEQVFVSILAERADENILLKNAQHIRAASSDKLVFLGNYNFPSGEASEVFISNVFDDDTIHADEGKNPKIIAEAFRMLQPGGTCIIQDTAYNMAAWLGDMLRDEGFVLVFGQAARSRAEDKDIAIAYESQFADMVHRIGLHYEGHSHLSLLIAQKPPIT